MREFKKFAFLSTDFYFVFWVVTFLHNSAWGLYMYWAFLVFNLNVGTWSKTSINNVLRKDFNNTYKKGHKLIFFLVKMTDACMCYLMNREGLFKLKDRVCIAHQRDVTTCMTIFCAKRILCFLMQNVFKT